MKRRHHGVGDEGVAIWPRMLRIRSKLASMPKQLWGRLGQVVLLKAREENEILNIDVFYTTVSKIALHLKHLLAVLLRDWLPDVAAAAVVPDRRNLVIKPNAGGVVGFCFDNEDEVLGRRRNAG